MSRFFRSPDSSGSDSSESSEDDAEELHSPNIRRLDISGDSLESIAVDRVARGVSSSARDWLLSALLEERCLNQASFADICVFQNTADRLQVRSEYRRDSTLDERDVQREALRRYQVLSSRLAPLDLISPGLDDSRHAAIRQNIRDRLDSVDLAQASDAALESVQPLQIQHALPAPLRRLLTDGDPRPTSAGSRNGVIIGSSSAVVGFDAFRSHTAPSALPRYMTDFEELGVLGKGGYGEVFHVKHHLDGRDYAVKKIPIRPQIIARIATEGEAAMEEILKEVRSLSRLDHPNVVRYFSSWIEWSSKSGFQSSSSELATHTMDRSPDASLGAEEILPLEHSLRRVRTESETAEEDAGITFDNRSHYSASIALDNVFNSESSYVGRALSTSSPHLALHIQQDVYPMTLADFISPNSNGTGVSPLCHCFHFETSLRLLLAIIEGVEYLHAENVVHRDLKPANIFLKHESNPKSPRSCVDLSICSGCGWKAHPAKLSVCIGDFGLVTTIAGSDESGARSSSAVGTEVYRPNATSSRWNVSPRLDVFAIGIIACELLHKFETQMERRSTLQGLKEGCFPVHFASCAGPWSNQVRDIIIASLQSEDITVAILKQRLEAIATAVVAPISTEAVEWRVST